MRNESFKQTAAEIIFILTLVFVGALLLPSCATSPEGRKQFIIVPDEQMATMGAQAFQELKAQQTIETDAKTTAYVQCVAGEIIHTLPSENQEKEWEVVVFKDPTPNAFALPGGKIGVHSGLLTVAKTPAQLATVIGHEVGHVLANHGAERVSEQFAAQGGLAVISSVFAGRGAQYDLLMSALGLGAQFGILLPHSRAQESEADVIGLNLMAQGGFDPQHSIHLWENMAKAGGGQPIEFLSTHPSHGTRIENLTSNMPEAMQTYKTVRSRTPASSACTPPAQ